MSKIIKVLFLAVVTLNVVLSAWFVLHKDILFTSEIARDFLLLDQLNQKKLVLIGPSSTTGLFHGPLWMYINFPAFVLGNGNPVIVGWFWILLVVVFLVSGFYFAKKLFDTKTAYLFTLMTSVYSIYTAKGFYNPHGAMLILPAFFFFFIRFLQTAKIKYLLIHVLLAGALIQFQMAIGIPFLILSFLYISLISVKQKHFRSLLSYLLIPLTLSNFLIFDLRHKFLLSEITIHFLTSAGRDHPNFLGLLYQRIKLMTTGVEFIRVDPGYRNLVVFGIFIALIILQIRQNRYKKIYLAFLYFYFGYLLLSLLNSGSILYFYFFPLFPLVFLIFSSFITSKYRAVFAVIFFVIFAFNMQAAFADQFGAVPSFGSSSDSWLFMKNAAQKLFSVKENGFGYFVYSPDSLAYREKYALKYVQKRNSRKALYFTKQPTTYIFIAPPPRGNPYMKEGWWISNELHINKSPASEYDFPNGYKIEKFELSDAEVKIPVEPNIDPGLTFR